MYPFPSDLLPKEKMWGSHDHQTCTSSNGHSSLTSYPYSEQTTSLNSHLLLTRHHCLATLQGQNSYTSALFLSGDYLFTGSSDGEIRQNTLTSLHDNCAIATDHDPAVSAGNGAVKSLVASSDKLITAHQDHKIRVWRIGRTASNHHQRITQLATLPTLTDRATKVLLPKNHIQIRRHKSCTWIHHVDTVSALALSADESLLYSVSWDRTLKIWRTTDFKCLESIVAHDDAINAIALSQNGDVFTGSSDHKIKLWRHKIGEKTHSLESTLEKHSAGVNALALSTDGTILYSGASDRSVLVWMSDGSGGFEAVGVLRGHKKAVLCLATVSDLVCSGSADKTVRIWRGIGKSYPCLAVLDGHRGPVKCITMAFDDEDQSYNPSNYVVYSASLDCDIKIWKVFLPIC